MTDYLGYTADEYAPDAPATSLHFRRWFENWIAAFEAAPGAPRIEPRALKNPVLGSGQFNGGAPLAFIGLNGVGALSGAYLVYNNSGSTASAATLAFSNDNGATWGAAQNLFTAGTDGSVYHLHLALNIVTGAFTLAGARIIASAQQMYLNTATLTVPTNCNGVRFGGAAASLNGNVALQIAGGRT